MSVTVEEVMARLAEPFEAHEVKVKPGVVSGNRALALHYVDARCVQDRLDDVLGTANWQDEYTIVDGGSVVCRLKIRLGDEWVTKTDVGSPSEQPDEGDRMKAAFSDALKRTAVKFGVGRYLYRLPQQWCDFDPQKRRFVKAPAAPTPPPREARPSPAQEGVVREKGLAILRVAAKIGRPSLETAWKTLSPDMRKVCMPMMKELAEIADAVPEKAAAAAGGDDA